jgi:hypothetical protein
MGTPRIDLIVSSIFYTDQAALTAFFEPANGNPPTELTEVSFSRNGYRQARRVVIEKMKDNFRH